MKKSLKKSDTLTAPDESITALGPNEPITSSGAFSASDILFAKEDSEMLIKSYIETSIENGGADFDHIKKYSQISNFSFSDEQIQSFIEEISILKKDFIDSQKESESIRKEKELVDQFIKNKTKATYHLAKYITEKYDIITVGEKEHEMFVYRDGIYFQAENEIIYPEIQRILGEHVTRSAKGETFNKICDMTAKSRSIFETADLKYIPLKNGVYNFETKELLSHSSNYKFKYKFPIIYSKNTQCPKTLKFFNQIFTEEQLPIIQEWLGYYFYRLYSFKKAIIFVGDGDTGKTTFLEVIINLLGKENKSSVPIQKMTVDKFSAAHLYEKHGNIVDELSAKDISDTGNFKMATGGGSMPGEYKFGNQFSFVNFAKFTFACNRIPDVKDFDDLAYFNRWMVIRFENTLEKKIPNFINQLITEEERSGLFNWSMEGLVRLLEQGRFSYNKDAEETKMEMMRSSSSTGEFMARYVIQQADSEITKEDMYDAYVKFCTENKLSVSTKKSFGMKFITLKYVSDGLIYASNGKRVEGWRNVAIKKSEEEIKEGEMLNAQFNEI